MTDLMTQCRLVRKHDGYLITWIPQNFAIMGKKLKLEETGEIFTVVHTKMKKSVMENSQDYKYSRKFLDI